MKTPAGTILVFATAFAALTPTLMAAAWSDLGQTRELGPGITPSIAVDRAGVMHVVFMHDGAILYRRAERNGQFRPIESLPAPDGRANYNSPHLVCDGSGTLHLVFARDATRSSKKAWYTSRQNRKWSAPIVALDHSGTERRINYPRIAVAPTGATAYVAAFAGGGSIVVRLENTDATPKAGKQIDTRLWVAHPLIGQVGEVLVAGRDASRGHKLERYSRDLDRIGEPLLLSHGTPTKTFEPTGAILDERGVVHVAGATQMPTQVLWYNTSDRAAAGKSVVIGPELGADISEFVYPVLLRDARQRIYVSYRDHATGESRLTVLESNGERFADPVLVAPMIARRLRWNAHLAASPGGGAYVVWDANERVYLRAVGEAAGEAISQ